MANSANTFDGKTMTDLSNEILLAIIARVDFSPENLLNASLINHQIHHLMITSKQVLLNDVANVQYAEANHLSVDKGNHTIRSLGRLKKQTEMVHKIITVLLREAFPQCTETKERKMGARLKAGLYIIQALADMNIHPLDALQWTVCTQVLGFGILSLIRATTTRIASYLRLKFSNRADTAVSLRWLGDDEVETGLLTGGVESIANLFNVDDDVGESLVVYHGQLPPVEEVYPARLPFLWVKALYEVFDDISAVTGAFSPAVNGASRLKAGDAIGDELLSELTSEDHVVHLSQDAAEHVSGFKLKARFDQSAAQGDTPLHHGPAREHPNALFAAAMWFDWDTFLGKEATSRVGDLTDRFYDPENMAPLAFEALQRFARVKRSEMMQKIRERVEVDELSTHVKFLVAKETFLDMKRLAEETENS